MAPLPAGAHRVSRHLGTVEYRVDIDGEETALVSLGPVKLSPELTEEHARMTPAEQLWAEYLRQEAGAAVARFFAYVDDPENPRSVSRPAPPKRP